MARLDGKVVFITGAARGQGRSHAVEMAKEGASIIAIDICEQIPTVFYPMSTKDDLDETVRQVEAAGGRIVARVADVRDRESLKAALADGVAEFGRVDALIANAGIMPLINEGADDRAWFDGIDVLLTGVWHSIEATLPYLLEQGQGGSIVITGSTSGNSGAGINRLPGMVSYSACKAGGVVGLMRIYASKLTQDMIRVNVVHPPESTPRWSSTTSTSPTPSSSPRSPTTR